MHIAVVFHFHDERRPAAVTEVEGGVSDVLLPRVGDTLSHRDLEGNRFRAQVMKRHFDYNLEDGEDIGGSITVVLSMKRLPVTSVH